MLTRVVEYMTHHVNNSPKEIEKPQSLTLTYLNAYTKH
jgi:hypothetical protein